jgi:hypothetical protein
MALSTTREAPVVRTLDIFQAFYGIRRFSTEFTRALHLFLSWVRPIQSISPHPTSLRSILILYIHLRLGQSNYIMPFKIKFSGVLPPFVKSLNGLFSSSFLTNFCTHFPYPLRAFYDLNSKLEDSTFRKMNLFPSEARGGRQILCWVT